MEKQKKVVLVTGASSGIGKAAAIILAQNGFAVYAAARRVERMEDLKSYGIVPMRLDISKDEEITALVDAVLEREPAGVDVLVNNAGFGVYGAVEDIAIADARYQFEVNVFGLARLTQLCIPAMRAKGQGRIINISSILGRVYIPFGAWYVSTKFALEGWSDCLRFELKPFGIDVVLVEPGLVKTEFSEVSRRNVEDLVKTSPYADHFVSFMQNKSRYSADGGSPASLLGQTILKAAGAKRPRIRYLVGRYARPLRFLRKLMSDRQFDSFCALALHKRS